LTEVIEGRVDVLPQPFLKPHQRFQEWAMRVFVFPYKLPHCGDEEVEFPAMDGGKCNEL